MRSSVCQLRRERWERRIVHVGHMHCFCHGNLAFVPGHFLEERHVDGKCWYMFCHDALPDAFADEGMSLGL